MPISKSLFITVLLSAVLGALFAFFTFPSSSQTWIRDLVLVFFVAVPTLGWWCSMRRQGRPISSAPLGLSVFLLSVWACGPLAARDQLDRAVEFCDQLHYRLERKFSKKGVYPRTLRTAFFMRPRHIRFRRNACHYHRHGRERYTLSLWRIDKPERIIYQSWHGRWVTATGDPW